MPDAAHPLRELPPPPLVESLFARRRWRLSRSEKVLRIGAYIFLGTVAAFFVLLLVVTMLAFLVVWLAN